MIPDKDGALMLLRGVGCSERVIQHCMIVSDHATRIAEKINEAGHQVDIELVQLGALLHDIGRSRTHGIEHAIIGADLAREHDLDIRLINIIIRHIGAGITAEESASLGFPPGNYVPETLEEKIVAHADNLVSDDTVLPLPRIVEILRIKGRNETIIERIVDLDREISGRFF